MAIPQLANLTGDQVLWELYVYLRENLLGGRIAAQLLRRERGDSLTEQEAELFDILHRHLQDLYDLRWELQGWHQAHGALRERPAD